VSAKGLPGADLLGKSDPYCICEAPGTPQSKVKTKTIMFNLNPKWNETFIVNGCAVGSALLEFTVMDWDLIGSDDFLGRATLKSDHLHGGCFEGELALSNGSKAAGFLQVIVRSV